jgi:hypothetical protein
MPAPERHICVVVDTQIAGSVLLVVMLATAVARRYVRCCEVRSAARTSRSAVLGRSCRIACPEG